MRDWGHAVRDGGGSRGPEGHHDWAAHLQRLEVARAAGLPGARRGRGGAARPLRLRRRWRAGRRDRGRHVGWVARHRPRVGPGRPARLGTRLRPARPDRGPGARRARLHRRAPRHLGLPGQAVLREAGLHPVRRARGLPARRDRVPALQAPRLRFRLVLGGVEDLGGRTLAGADGAVDGAVRGGRRLGAGPVDAAPRLAEEVAVAREDAGLEVRHRAAAGPLLVPPGGLDEVDRRRRLRPEPGGEGVEHAAGAARPRGGRRTSRPRG